MTAMAAAPASIAALGMVLQGVEKVDVFLEVFRVGCVEEYSLLALVMSPSMPLGSITSALKPWYCLAHLPSLFLTVVPVLLLNDLPGPFPREKIR